MLPPVLLMHMLDGSHSEVHFGHVKLPSKEFPSSPQTPWFYGSSSPYRAPIQGPPQGPPLAEARCAKEPAGLVRQRKRLGFARARLGLGWLGFRLAFGLDLP